MNTFIWFIVAYGMTHIITGSKIFEPMRDFFDKISKNFWGVLFSCPACMGFWVGVFLNITMYPIIEHNALSIQNPYLLIIMHNLFTGCASSGINWIIYVLLDLTDKKTLFYEIKNELLINNPKEIL